MTRIIEVTVSNGYHDDIRCKLTADKHPKEENSGYAGVGVGGVEIKAGRTKKYKGTKSPISGYFYIGSGKKLKTSLTTDRDVYLSIEVNGELRFDNHAISKDKTFIVDKDKNILNARTAKLSDKFADKQKKNKYDWIDRDGVDHRKSPVPKKNENKRGNKEEVRKKEEDSEEEECEKEEDGTEEEPEKEKDDKEVDNDKRTTPTHKKTTKKRKNTTTNKKTMKKRRTAKKEDEDEVDDDDDEKQDDNEERDSA